MKEIDAAREGLSEGLSNSIAQLIEKIALGMFSSSTGFVGKVKTETVTGFEDYFVKTRHRVGMVKTLISRAEPVPLDDVYEPVSILRGKDRSSIDDLIRDTVELRHVILTGRLGAGKSFSMRYFFRRMTDQNIGKIPVLLELRSVDYSKQDIIAGLVAQIRPFAGLINEGAVAAGLRAGVFVLILDGLDEVAPEFRDKASKDILELASEYPDTTIVVSSRPDDDRFIGWSTFHECRIQPLTENQVVHLVTKIKYEEGDKRVFIKKIRDGLYASHSTLLSNPLLASMMLLTFNEFQSIPSKMYIFYAAAYDVLYRKHDATKVDFSRKFYSELDQHDFKQIFMTLCFFSYVDRVFYFNEEQINRYVGDAAQYEAVSVNPSKYIRDLIENMCILLAEGDRVGYLHRSFQEYFSALFLSRRSISSVSEFVDGILRTGQEVDESISMFIDMDREEFEWKYFVEKLGKLLSSLVSMKSTSDKLSVFGPYVMFGHLKGGRLMITIMQPPVNNENSCIIRILSRHYGKNTEYTKSYARKSWESALPKKYAVGDFKAFRVDELSDSFVTRFGVGKWLEEIESEIVATLQELEAIHGAKSSLLSSRLSRWK